ncbi:MAG TPA: amino acid adenylation domain-containing protein, partial [Thermoanaerobaculia bacterium]
METVTEFLKELASKGVKLSAEAGRLNCYAPQGVLTADMRDGIARHKPEILTLLNRGAVRPSLRREHALVTAQEAEMLLVQFNGPSSDYPRTRCIHQLFAEQVALDPEKTAVVFNDREMTYRELDEKSRALGVYLQSMGVGPDSVVGLCVERSLDRVVGLLGILQAGGAYLPVDPDYPDERIAYMLQDSGAAIVLTQATLRQKLASALTQDVRIVALDEQWAEIVSAVGANASLRQGVGADHLAYVTYTSGSTGQPKGVMIEHHSVNRLVLNTNYLDIAKDDVFLQISSLSFDAATLEIWGPLLNGAKLVVAPPGQDAISQLGALVRTHKITVLWLTSGLFQLIVAEDLAALSGVRVLLTGGDVVPVESARKFLASANGAVLVNGYGPTENTTFTSCHVMSGALDDALTSLPIGRPIANTRVYILDSHDQLQPHGVAGELHIAGDGLARGYRNRPELTAEKFVADPFVPGARMYRSGDQARWLPDGTIEFLGRRDTQVKVRGLRIETGEIEARLNGHPGIRDSVVVAQGGNGNKQLIAFYLAKDSNGDGLVTFTARDLRIHLQQNLPAYMLPAAFVSLAAIPLNPSGKVDRRALAQMDVTIDSGQDYLAPRNEAETALVAICADVLNRAPETIGVDDNFFELGGDSLLATQLTGRIRRQLGIDLSLSALFARPTVADFAELLRGAGTSDVPAIVPFDRTKVTRLPLSFVQERLWFIDQLQPGSAGYNVPLALTITGELNADHLDHAFNQIIARHEALRTVFPSEEGRPRQLILDAVDFQLERVDVSNEASLERDRRAREICETDAATPFDLARGPLLRGKLIRLAEREHILLLNMHHIVSDGWSLGILIRELGLIMDALAADGQPDLAPLPIQYADYSVWQREWLDDGGTLKQQLAYWQDKLAGLPDNLGLATDYPRPPVQTFAGATHAFTLDAELAGQLKELAQEQGGTLFMTLLGICNVLLHRYTGQNDICVGTPIANRQYAETEGLIGMFANTLALRSRVDGGDTVSALLAQVKATCLEAYEHQDAPFEKIVELLRPERNLAITPIFQVMVILQNADIGALDEHFPRYPLDLESGFAKFDLTAEFTETATGLTGSFKYNTMLYAPETIQRMAGHFTALCRAVAATPHGRIGDLDFLGEAETHELLAGFNDTRTGYLTDVCLHELFAMQAARDGGRTAVVSAEEQLTYQQLHEKSQDLALYLQSLGVQPDRLIGLCMERSVDLVAGLLGILKAGGAYLPLDPDYPDERLSHMLHDSRAAIVLTQGTLTEKLSALLPAGTRIVAIDRQWAEIAERVAELKAQGVQLQQQVQPHHLAYVIYTSGSTGQSKGVMVEHRSAVNLFFALKDSVYAEARPGSLRVSVNGPLTFDTSVKQIIQLLDGHILEIIPEDVRRDGEALLRYVRDRRIEVFDCTPSQLRLLLEAGLGRGTAESLQLVLVGGEAIDESTWATLAESEIRFFNVYGPTECTVDATVAAIRSEKNPLPTIGRPIANVQVYVLDQQSHTQPIGVPGELCIAGAGVARGYLNRDELTRETFVANPFVPGTRMYKTGDLARWRADGSIQYLGRTDDQVKIRGFRMELGEIEARLNEHPSIAGSAVIAQGHDGDKQLVAFYRAKETTADHLAELSYEELRAHLTRSLPESMVPAAFVSLAEIPLTPNGKADRLALARLEVTIASGREYVAPRNDTERQVAAVWAEVLNLAPEQIGINDNFFELGGHSLLATQLIAKTRARLDIDLPLKAVFERASVAQLAALIVTSAKSAIPPMEPIDRTQFERLPLSFVQERLWFVDQLTPDSAGYNVPVAFTIRGELNLDHLDRAFETILARHETLRTVFPSEEGQARQLIRDHVDFQLQRVDVSHSASTEERDRKARELCEADAAIPFDLTRGPLLRAHVIKLEEHEHILMLTMHHIVTDGWSLGILVNELRTIMDALREGRQPELAPLPIQYVDYAVWQRRWLEEGGILKEQLAYWKEKLAGGPESLDLLTDYPRAAVQSLAGATRTFTLDPSLSAQLKRLAETEGATLFMVLLAAFKTLLYRYTAQSDLCVGSPIANRQHGETEGLIGMFANTLALRSHVEGDDTFAALLSQVKTTCLEAYEHQDAPFEKVVETLGPQRNLAVTPIFQVMLVLQNADIGALDDRFPRYLDLESGTSKFDLTAAFTETPDGLAGLIEYSTALYKPETIARLIGHFTALCGAIAATPAARIRDLEYRSEAETRRLLIDFNDTRVDYPNDVCLHDLFAKQAALHGGDTAVVFGDEQLTYQQLHEKSQDLALYLQSLGVGPDSLVGLCMERSLEMMVAMLGILQAGGAYVPLDPEYPDERLLYMLHDSHAAVLLTQKRLQNQLEALMPSDTRLITVDGQRAEIAAAVAALKTDGVSLQAQVQPRHLAYVIYTSGSTGQPKGVAIEHHSAVTLVQWASGVYGREELAGVLASTSICFDLSVYEIFVTLANGGTIVLVPNVLALINLPAKTAVTLINTVPSAMEELVRAGAIPGTVRTINLAGEPLSTALVDTIYNSTSVNKVYDLYGPSEDTTYSTYTLRTKDAPPTIGRPIANTQVYILDAYGHPQPVGVAGELNLAGDGLARGYLNRPALTEEKFVANPFLAGTRIYKTGDLARWLDDGTLQYLGRIDTQVKVRGFRIELGEIEARLHQHAEIQDCAVIANGQDAQRQLIAFYRAKETTDAQLVELPAEELRTHVMRSLPEYMVPAAFVSLPAIPLTPNGKIDRRALARIDVTIVSGREYVAPRNDAERQVVEIWAEVLNLAPETIGINENFFELGGHSLLATRMVAKVRSRLGVDLPLKALFEHTSVAQFAELVAKGKKSEVPAIRRIDRRLPLSFAQERLWFMNQLEPGSAGYNVPVAFTLRGALNIGQLEQAFNLIIARHQTLRTIFPSQDGQAQQRILDRVDFVLERVDVSQYTNEEERAAKAREICQTDAAEPFDLAEGPLFRGKIIRISEHEHILMLTMHHIVSDGWSLGILIKELGLIMDALGQGRRPDLPPLPIQYVDYSAWQRKWLEEGGVLEQQLAYWQRKLAGVPESLDLLTDYPRPNVQSLAGATHRFSLDAQLTRQLKSIAERNGGTLYMILLAAFDALLYRYTGQSDICVGTVIANRQQGETEDLLGMFANTLALRSRVDPDDTFAALLAQVRATSLEAYEHQDTPFEKIVEMLRPQRNLASTPIFQVMLVLQNADTGSLDQRFPRYPLETGISKFDLTAEFTERPDGLAALLEYSTALYKPSTIARMAAHFLAICRAIAATPAVKIRDLDLIGEVEKHQLLVTFNDTDADDAEDRCLHQLFADQVALHAGETAVVWGGERLTYQQLYDRSHDLALYLQSQGVQPDGLVGLCLERSLDMIVGMLGILQAGGAYVPLDAGYPDERLSYMLQDSKATIVLTQDHLRHKLQAFMPAGTQLVTADGQWAEIQDHVTTLKANKVPLQQQVQSHHLAYVIYTSGSTGQPKGVAIEHHSAVTLVRWAGSVYSGAELARVLASTSISFDLSVYEIFATLLNGGTVVLVPNVLALIDLPAEAAVTLINTVPSAMEELVRSGAIPSSVKTINLAGEPLSSALVDTIYDSSSTDKVYDLYGPSEDTTYSTFTLRTKNAPPSIGRPVANTQVYILDRYNQPQPIGVPGELHLAGDGLARGYLNRAQLTQEKFVSNPFVPDTRMYKTGDLARWLDDGTLQYLGRIDTQVKVRGFRIELGEIEARLSEYAGVQDCAVITQGEAADKQLVAFYRAKGTTVDFIVDLPYDELRAHLTRTLPEYMVPAAFVSLAAIPLTPNRKIDRRALAAMDVTIASGREYVAPRTETEKQLVEIWAQVLDIAPEKIGVNDNFFELGGHSLLATRLIARIRGQLDVEIPLKALFEQANVAQFAELIARAGKSGIPPIERVDRAQLERLPLSFVQERLWFLDQFEPDSAAYNIPVVYTIRGELDLDQLDRALNVIIARHESLRTVFRSQDGQPAQRVLETLDFQLERVDLRPGPSEEARHRKTTEICEADAAKPFDLARGPLLRGTVIQLAEQEHVLLLDMHHIISDGWSLGVLIEELGTIMDALRDGRDPELAPLPIQYVDYSVWQRKWLDEGGILEQQLAYWQQKLAGVPESLDLLTDYPRPGVQSLTGGTHSFMLDAQLAGQMKRLAERKGGTIFMVLLAAFKSLLYRYTGQSDICVGTPIANRQYEETASLIGMFVNTLALRSQVEEDDTFAELLAKVIATCVEAYEHQDTPFEKVVEMLRPERNLAITPIFQVMFVVQNAAMALLDRRFPRYPLDTHISKFDLSVEFIETPDGLAGSIEYSTALFRPQTIARLAEHFVALCRAITATPAAKVRDLKFIGEAETHRLLTDFNDTRAEYPAGQCLHELFIEQVALHADKAAVVFGGEQLTYQQLDQRSDDLALYLQSIGVGPDSLVGLCIERSPDMIAGMLGILKAGGAYVPLDPDYPEERLSYMLRDSGATIVLTQETLRQNLETLMAADTRLIVIGGQWTELDGRVAELRTNGVQLQRQVKPHHLAYVVYTSGSTGEPKGVAIEHHSPVTLVQWASSVYEPAELAGVLASTSICFDLSVYEIFVTLSNGGTVVLVPNVLALINLSPTTPVTLINTVPSAMEELVRLGSIPDSVRTINLAGEALSSALVDAIYDGSSANKVYDLYGPSEDTTYSTFTLRQPNAAATIGRPIANTQVYILDASSRPQPIGVPGELHLAG